jgi:hypothetical protein
MPIWLLIAAIQIGQPEPLRLPPTDECGGEPSFVAYRARLSAAIARKDAAALRPLVDSHIMYNFGDDDGWPGFVRNWHLDRPADSDLWLELSQVMNLGCEVDGDQRIAPGNFNRLSDIGEGLPPFFAVRKDAALRSRPDDKAALVTLLDYHVLIEILDDEPEAVPEGWLHARLTNGQSGYVRLSAVRSALDYRAGFEKRSGQWVMTSFVAGD